MSRIFHLALDAARLPGDALWRLGMEKLELPIRPGTKRVALVGNGPSVKRSRGEEIDRCDRVTRFNYYPLGEHEARVGRRCTDWVLAATSTLVDRLAAEGESALDRRLEELETLWLFPPPSVKVATKLERLFWGRDVPRREIPAALIARAQQTLGGYPPTAGFIFLMSAVECFPDYEIRVTGIGDGARSLGRHYFDARHRPWWRHNLRRERMVVRHLLRAGAVRSL